MRDDGFSIDSDSACLYVMTTGNHPNRIRFRLALTAEQYLAFYQGSAQEVVTRSDDNRIVRFPANAIRKFVTREGIYGHFEMTFDKNNKLIGIESIE